MKIRRSKIGREIVQENRKNLFVKAGSTVKFRCNASLPAYSGYDGVAFVFVSDCTAPVFRYVVKNIQLLYLTKIRCRVLLNKCE